MPREGEKRPLLKHAIIAAIALVGMAVPTIAEAVEAEPTPDTSRLQVATLPAPARLAVESCLSSCVRAIAKMEASDPSTTQPAPAETATPEPWPTMELRPGDTLSDLAAWFGLSLDELAAANGISDVSMIGIGQVLVIPVPASLFLLPPEPVLVPVETPTPAVVLEAAPAAPAAPGFAPWPAGPEDVIAAICSLPWPCDVMVSIARCESGLRPHAYNPRGYYGLFQINYAFEGWDNPWTNARVAYEAKYLPAAARGDPYGPWPICGP